MTALHRLVQDGGTYPARPPEATYVDFLGWGDPGAAMQVGDTWTQTPPPPPTAPPPPPRSRTQVAAALCWSARLAF